MNAGARPAGHATDLMRAISVSIVAFIASLALAAVPPHARAAARSTHGCRTPARRVLRPPLAVWGTGCQQAPTSPRLFAADSVWNAPLSASSTLDPSSVSRMATFSAEVDSEVSRGIGPWISDTSYSTPLYTVSARQRKVTVALDTGSWGAPLERALKAGVPIPDNARPAAGTDGHLTIWQPSTDTLWEFWKAVRRLAAGTQAGAASCDTSRGTPGITRQSSWSGLSAAQGWNWGSTATSLPVIAGTVMIDELRRGRIDHALALAIPDACVGVFSWPAQRTDGTDPTTECLPEGAHLRLDPSLDLSSLTLPPITRMLADAAQRYGLIVRDRTHHAVGFYAEDPTPHRHRPVFGRRRPVRRLTALELPAAVPMGPTSASQDAALSTSRAVPPRPGNGDRHTVNLIGAQGLVMCHRPSAPGMPGR